MSAIIMATGTVHTDEPCLGLAEMNLPRPDSKGIHRYMIIYVVRDDRTEEFRLDLGPATSFAVEEFRIPGGVQDPRNGRLYVEHTVGELVEIANVLRERPREETAPQTPDLIQRFYDQPEVRRRRRKRVSTFGYGQTTQRS